MSRAEPPPEYVFGYGSLIQTASRGVTLPEATTAVPARVRGFRRSWSVRGVPVGFSGTFLGVWEDADAAVNGVITPVAGNVWGRLDLRERGYRRVPIDRAAIEWLDDPADIPDDAKFFVYRVHEPAEPDRRYPIIQSYVDICLDGCLAVDELLGGGDAFAREFVRSTTGWCGHWVNDRLYPRAPHRMLPRAGQIDGLLAEHCPEAFAQITIE